jgi:hypothetical protein
MTVSAPTKHDFDSLRVEIVGFIRTQLVAAPATLRLAEHLRDGALQADDFAACTGLDPTIAFRFLRACELSIANRSRFRLLSWRGRCRAPTSTDDGR